MQTLKTILYETIKNAGTQTQNDIEAICHFNNYKISNAERRLRELMASGSIKPIKNDKGAIIGYKHIQSDMVKIPIIGTVDSRTRKINYTEKAQKIVDPLDNQLRALIGGKTWEQAQEIQRAIKSDQEWLKKATIRKYGG